MGHRQDLIITLTAKIYILSQEHLLWRSNVHEKLDSVIFLPTTWFFALSLWLELGIYFIMNSSLLSTLHRRNANDYERDRLIEQSTSHVELVLVSRLLTSVVYTKRTYWLCNGKLSRRSTQKLYGRGQHWPVMLACYVRMAVQVLAVLPLIQLPLLHLVRQWKRTRVHELLTAMWRHRWCSFGQTWLLLAFGEWPRGQKLFISLCDFQINK